MRVVQQDPSQGGYAGLRLFGREVLLGRVEAAIARATDGSRSVLLVSGAAGSGKTALVRAALAGVRAPGQDGAPLVAWGTCVESGTAPGFWPWTQVLNRLVRHLGRERAVALAGSDAGLLATIAPALGDPTGTEESARARMLLMDAVVAWLDAAALGQPLVLVLDDVQWVDESSLALLELVVRDATPAGICLVAMVRDDELAPPLRDRVRALLTQAPHLALPGLDRKASQALAEDVLGSPLSREQADTIYRRAAGHPLFTRELALASQQGPAGALALPGVVREAIEHRVRTLAPVTQRVLRVAAAAGLEVLPDVVAAAAGLTPTEVLAAASEAADVGILTSSEGRYAFAHDLFRESLDTGGQADSGPELHLALGRALEQRAGRTDEAPAAALARHFRLAVPVAGVERAVHWALRAAEADRAALALSEASRHLRLLRTAVADAGVTLGDAQLVEVLLVEADVLARAGRATDARGLLRTARERAERVDGSQVARVALAVAALGSTFAARRDEVVGELQSALEVVAGSEPMWEAQLCAALARELQHSVATDRPRAAAVSLRALELGRAAGDPDTLAACLLARHDVLWGPGQAAERAELATEIVSLATAAGQRDRQAQGLLLQSNALVELGSPAFEPTLLACLALLEDLGEPRHLYTATTRRGFLALLRAEPGAADLVAAAAELGERLGEPDTANVAMSQRLELVRTTGGPAELLSFASEAVAHWTGAPVHAHAVAAGFCARAGDEAAARRHVDVVLELGTWRADRSYLWTVLVRELAVAAAALEDELLCMQLLDDVLPLAPTCGVNGAAVAFSGSHAHIAGVLALATGEQAQGRELLAQARDVYARLGAVSFLADVEADLGRLAVPGDRAALRRRGDVWDIRFGDQSATAPHCKGLSDLAKLLARPGVEIHVLDLVGSPDASGAAGEVTDRTAARAYRERLAALQEERVMADRAGDLDRLSAVDSEHDSLVAELRGASAGPGRVRRFSNYPAERARKAVTARIRDAVRRLDRDLPALAEHLDQHVVTGVRCRYRGDVSWSVSGDPPAGAPRD